MLTALVTGSTQGIGKSIAEKLVKKGYNVIIHCSKDLEKAERVRKELNAYKAVVADLSNLSETESLYSKTGKVDILICNASVQYKQFWLNATDNEIKKQIDVNFFSTLKLIQMYYPDMEKNNFGRIITIGSVNQYREHRELSVYAATKCAVMSLIKNIAKYSASFNITANNIAPGAILTPRNIGAYNNEEIRKNVEKVIPKGRFGTPDEIADVAEFICGENASYITGADIIVDGGMHLN